MDKISWPIVALASGIAWLFFRSRESAATSAEPSFPAMSIGGGGEIRSGKENDGWSGTPIREGKTQTAKEVIKYIRGETSNTSESAGNAGGGGRGNEDAPVRTDFLFQSGRRSTDFLFQSGRGSTDSNSLSLKPVLRLSDSTSESTGSSRPSFTSDKKPTFKPSASSSSSGYVSIAPGVYIPTSLPPASSAAPVSTVPGVSGAYNAVTTYSRNIVNNANSTVKKTFKF